MLDQNHQKRYYLKKSTKFITQSTVHQRLRGDRKKEIILEEKESVMYDEVKPIANFAQTAISLKSNIEQENKKISNEIKRM